MREAIRGHQSIIRVSSESHQKRSRRRGPMHEFDDTSSLAINGTPIQFESDWINGTPIRSMALQLDQWHSN
jgi:hypothetical protein